MPRMRGDGTTTNQQPPAGPIAPPPGQDVPATSGIYPGRFPDLENDFAAVHIALKERGYSAGVIAVGGMEPEKRRLAIWWLKGALSGPDAARALAFLAPYRTDPPAVVPAPGAGPATSIAFAPTPAAEAAKPRVRGGGVPAPKPSAEERTVPMFGGEPASGTQPKVSPPSEPTPGVLRSPAVATSGADEDGWVEVYYGGEKFSPVKDSYSSFEAGGHRERVRVPPGADREKVREEAYRSLVKWADAKREEKGLSFLAFLNRLSEASKRGLAAKS